MNVEVTLNEKTPTDPRFAKTQYVVEATNTEQFFMWKLEHKECEWVQDNMGLSINIANIGDSPIMVSFSWVTINNVLVMFYEATSRVVHHGVIEDWIEKWCNPFQSDGRRAHSDAMNFSYNNLKRVKEVEPEEVGFLST